MVCICTSHSFDTCIYVPVGSIWCHPLCSVMTFLFVCLFVCILFLGHVALWHIIWDIILLFIDVTEVKGSSLELLISTAHVDCWYHRTVRCLSWSWKYIEDLLILDCGYKPVSLFDDVTVFLRCDEQYEFLFLLIWTPLFPCNGVICYPSLWMCRDLFLLPPLSLLFLV